ncbi:unnamed protein product [Clonostachys rhizophaga]|uniref:Uncharacterized protein n=1 Tax=Clonostachys rhizophaga TaxID=160324 RepID=A0A9N9VS00_9HYPO|nr:unnamed protein product [Clonostachys rhizophaga]
MLFYDSELELFINDEPLLISSKTQNAAKDIGINLSWDQNGYIHKVSHADVMDLSAKLGEMRDSTGKILDVPSSRPGWFDLDNVGADGLPTSVSTSYASQAKANNKSRNLPLTVVKQIIYNTQFDRVVQEKISMFFNDRFHDKGFRSAILNIVKSARTAMHGYHHVSCKGNDVVITDVPHQTPRLLLAPLLEGIVREHLRFFRAKSIGMYVSCGFYTNEQGDYGQVNKEPSVKTGITFNEVKALLAEGSPETSLMTLPQYWKVYRECLELNDSVTLKSLQDSDHVELLDTVFYHCSSVKHGNQKQPTQQSILMARPSLIRPDDINLKTGLPDRLTSPDNYGDTELWRYWYTRSGRERSHARSYLRHGPDMY